MRAGWRSEPAPGRYYVHPSCVDCDTCRAIAPDHFVRHHEREQAIVCSQPLSSEQVERVEEALDCCPVAAIRRRGDATEGLEEPP